MFVQMWINVKIKDIVHFHCRKGSMSGTSLQCPSKALGMDVKLELYYVSEALELFYLFSKPQNKIWASIYSACSIQSISKFDERCCFLYVHDNSDDFQIYFSTEEQCGRWGHISRCVCVGVRVSLRLCPYSTYVWPCSRVTRRTGINGNNSSAVMLVPGSAPWWKRWYRTVRGTPWSWRGKEMEIHWRSGGVQCV